MIDYKRHGGNCMPDSAVFVHCPGPLRNEFNSVTPQWTEWSEWSYCSDCGSENKRFKSRLCQNEGETVNMGLCGRGPSFEIKACHACPDIDSYDYSLVIDKINSFKTFKFCYLSI